MNRHDQAYIYGCRRNLRIAVANFAMEIRKQHCRGPTAFFLIDTFDSKIFKNYFSI